VVGQDTASRGLPEHSAGEVLPAKPARVLRRVLVTTHPAPEANEDDDARQSGEETGSTKSSEEEPLVKGAAPAPEAPQPEKEFKEAPWLIGEAVAFDESGEPIILRQVDPESGRARHVVRNADGSLHTFGERTIESLMCSEDAKARRWLAQLSSRDVRGLVHTLGHRLLQSSQLYQQQHVQLVNCADSADYHFFGLCPDCSEHDLDLAYRKMAKQLHPDKNGGTEYAKRRFQNMKERYESLKQRRQQGCQGPSDKEESTDREDPEGAEDNGRIEFDPADRSSLDQTVWKMLHQLRTLKEGLEEIARRLRRCHRH